MANAQPQRRSARRDLGSAISQAARRLRAPRYPDSIPLHFGVLTAGASGSPPMVEVDGKEMRYLSSYTTHNVGDVVVYVKNHRGECVVLGELHQ